MGIETAIIGAAILGAGAQVYSGIQQKKAANKEAALIEAEAAEKAAQEETAADRMRRQQKVLFLKSGVTLEGSPLQVMAETLRVGSENAARINRFGGAKASNVRSSGQAALTGSLLSAASTGASAFGNYKTLDAKGYIK